MEQKKNKRQLWKRIGIGIAVGCLSVILLLGIVVYAVWHNEIFTIASMELVRERNDAHFDGAVYTMHVKGGFYLEDFIAQGGVKSDAELIEFVTAKITKGLLDMGISESEIACSSFTAKSESGDVLFARNYDFAKTNTCIVFTEANEGRHATITIL